MNRSLPEEQDRIRRHLIGSLIARPSTVEDLVDGCAAIALAFITVLGPLLGDVGTTAVMRRASTLARLRHSLLAGLLVTATGLYDAHLRADLRNKEPNQVGEALAGLVDALFEVLHELLGNSLLPVLQEIETELVAGGRISPTE